MVTALRWLISGVCAVALLALVAAITVGAILYAQVLRPARPVGFQEVSIPDARGVPLAAAIWYPTTARPRLMLLGFGLQQVAPNGPVAGQGLPLVMISHGNGGGRASHVDTALALAAAGFVVVAPTHTGDNYADQGEVGSLMWLTDRARSVRSSIDYMLGAWPGRDRIDPARIGIFGFSAGGFTALTAIGGEPDLSRIAPQCLKADEFACHLWKPEDAPLPGPDVFVHEPRIRAAVIAAPGFGFVFVPHGLARVRAKVELWAGDADDKVPYASNTGPVRAALGVRAQYRNVPGAGHFAFLTPCDPLGPAFLCRDAKGFNRRAFHRAFNAEVVRFFAATLAAPST
jgi:predicted dienelactone hydrolase